MVLAIADPGSGENSGRFRIGNHVFQFGARITRVESCPNPTDCRCRKENNEIIRMRWGECRHPVPFSDAECQQCAGAVFHAVKQGSIREHVIPDTNSLLLRCFTGMVIKVIADTFIFKLCRIDFHDCRQIRPSAWRAARSPSSMPRDQSCCPVSSEWPMVTRP